VERYHVERRVGLLWFEFWHACCFYQSRQVLANKCRKAKQTGQECKKQVKSKQVKSNKQDSEKHQDLNTAGFF